MKEIQNKIIRRCKEDYPHVPTNIIVGLNNILTEEFFLKVNPELIDEVRFVNIFHNRFGHGVKWETSQTKEMVEEYNSTLPERKEELKPLPDECPNVLLVMCGEGSARDMWNYVIHHYGIPESKKTLPSVEELGKELCDMYIDSHFKIDFDNIAQHVIGKYYLSENEEEWWKTCEKFRYKDSPLGIPRCGYRVTKENKIFLLDLMNSNYKLENCSPYTEPSIIDIAKEKLGEEDFQKLIKEIKNA